MDMESEREGKLMTAEIRCCTVSEPLMSGKIRDVV